MPNVPFSFEYLNQVESQCQPAFLQIKNTGLARFFKRYLMQEAISVFQWNLPENWDADYFRYVLMGWGYICILKTDLFGVIPQQCTLSGLNVFYRPSRAIVANPLINSRDMKIGEDCAIIKLAPDYSGIADLVDNYGNMMALAYETTAINILNSKLSFVFNAEDKAEADAFKVMFDAVSAGQPAVVLRKRKSATIDKNSAWQAFAQNVGQNYIAPEVLETLRSIRDEFLTEIGIPNLATRKKERVNLDESTKNTFETQCKSLLWLEELQDGVKKAVEMFPEISGLSVNLRYEGAVDDAISVVDSGTV